MEQTNKTQIQEKINNQKENIISHKIIWQSTPSQWVNFETYFLCFLFCILIFPIFIAIWIYLSTKNTQYELTEQTLTLHTGVLNKAIDDVELYRIKDIRLEQPILLRIFGLGNIYLITSDQTNPNVTLKAINNSKELRAKLRQLVEIARKTRGVREFDTF